MEFTEDETTLLLRAAYQELLSAESKRQSDKERILRNAIEKLENE